MVQILNILYQAAYRFFGNMISPLNKNEPEVPLPYDMQIEHARLQIKKLEIEREAHRKRLAAILPHLDGK